MHKEIIIDEDIDFRGHEFYCDNCNQFLGRSLEYTDGYYKRIGEYDYSFYIDGWYHKKTILCESCKKAFDEKLQLILQENGFSKGTD